MLNFVLVILLFLVLSFVLVLKFVLMIVIFVVLNFAPDCAVAGATVLHVAIDVIHWAFKSWYSFPPV